MQYGTVVRFLLCFRLFFFNFWRQNTSDAFNSKDWTLKAEAEAEDLARRPSANVSAGLGGLKGEI